MNERVAGVVEMRQVVDMEIEELYRSQGDRQLPGGPFTLAYRCRHQHLHDFRLDALRGPRMKQLPLNVVFVDDPGVRPSEHRRARDDRAEHRLKVEGGADRLTDLAERLELADRAGELLRPLLQLAEQAGVLDRDHRLIGEGLEERDLVLG